MPSSVLGDRIQLGTSTDSSRDTTSPNGGLPLSGHSLSGELRADGFQLISLLARHLELCLAS